MAASTKKCTRCQKRRKVAQTLVVVSGDDVQYSEPKTAKGRRSIALDETTRESLKLWRESQLVERALWVTRTRTRTLSSVARTGRRCIRTSSQTRSGVTSQQRTCRASASTICDTRTRPWRSLPWVRGATTDGRVVPRAFYNGRTGSTASVLARVSTGSWSARTTGRA
jgi:hypothetical protein